MKIKNMKYILAACLACTLVNIEEAAAAPKNSVIDAINKAELARQANEARRAAAARAAKQRAEQIARANAARRKAEREAAVAGARSGQQGGNNAKAPTSRPPARTSANQEQPSSINTERSEKSRLCAKIRGRSDSDIYLEYCAQAAQLGDEDAAIFLSWKLFKDESNWREAFGYILPFVDMNTVNGKCNNCEFHEFQENKYPRHAEKLFADAIFNNSALSLEILKNYEKFKYINLTEKILNDFAFNAFKYTDPNSAVLMLLRGKVQFEKPFSNATFNNLTISSVQFDGYSQFFQGNQEKNWFLYIRPGQKLMACNSNLNVWNSEVAKQIERHICDSVRNWSIENARNLNGIEQESVHTIVMRLACQSSRASNVTSCEFDPLVVKNSIG